MAIGSNDPQTYVSFKTPADLLNCSAFHISAAINATDAKIPKITSFICTDLFLKRKIATIAENAATIANANSKKFSVAKYRFRGVPDNVPSYNGTCVNINPAIAANKSQMVCTLCIMVVSCELLFPIA